ncbi:TfoX/Sxy family DNA transformation protein [Sediminibacterium sp.]|uniref:TfoX/Sxy family DNA transformation protein n=1 Tax=Sediminibacterium sp. TaxID=1917865 RepID=UPI0027355064|nr:TfoX/Sxy family DNA transformation protein [Sediminibacterium sp.]MDP3394714.1 TfoX/Sxy family DNA transformation protein [Sediminibacterium sp.]MDP3568549.1 TfoX/Sxy family DNA transformation protein [Sediminibacterium sp.]
MNDLKEIKNFGPYMVKVMNLIRIYSREELMASDYKKIKKDLIKAGVNPHPNIFYSIEMGLQNKRWNEITSVEKKEIKKILADIK